MSEFTSCVKCKSENIYQDGQLWICPECGHEWMEGDEIETLVVPPSEEEANAVKDAHGQELKDGDSVTLIKELKVKGASSAVKIGTKVRNIRLVQGHDGHNISCRIDGIGSLYLKSEFVKKS